MGETGEGIARQLHHRRLAPRRVGTVRLHYLGIAWRRRIGDTLRQVHLPAVGREAARALVVGAVHARHRHRLGPLALVVFRGIEYVARLHARDAAKLVALRLLACRGEVNLVGVIAEKHRRVVGAAAIQLVEPLHGVAAAHLPYLRRAPRRLQSCLCHAMAWHGVERDLKLRRGVFVVAVSHEQARQGEMVGAAVCLIAYGVAVSHYRLSRLQALVVAERHAASYGPTRLPLLGRSLLVSLFEVGGGIEILTQGEFLLTPFHVLVGTARR